MAYCAKCGKETKEGQIYCEDCLSNMEDGDTFSDLFDSMENQSEIEDTINDSSNESDHFADDDANEDVDFVQEQSLGENHDSTEDEEDDDFARILEELQGPKEEIVDSANKEKKNSQPSSVSDVFSDAVSAISSLEDELADMPELENLLKEGTQDPVEKKKGFFARLFSKKSKDGKEDATDKKALKKEAKEKAKQEKAEAKQQKKETKAKLAEEKMKSEQENGDSPSPEKKAKKEKAAKAKKEKPAKTAKPKKEKPAKKKKEKPKKEVVEEVIVEDEGHVNRPIATFILVTFAVFAGMIIVTSLRLSYNHSIHTAEQKFEKQKYNQAYDEIAGIKVKRNDEELYDKIMTVMYVNKQLNSYNNYCSLEMYPEALDSLIKGLRRYDKYIDEAKKLGITKDLEYVRKQILTELKREFKVSEKKAMKLEKMNDQTKYSIKIYDIVLER